ncbi:glycosyltransferase [Hymenobacter actinosclerus]|uniref:Glycosyl transferases group 1 n=1 Tax=Hymenobacter actinosclerus TaxID=82805 RepID=A0A1I0J587_9BACT|nr:glycosyltransferase [Hymenobacter actinosclerus]SEU04292.1 Glycosyl transferases group 1 [Hymenobacter actinosclerus]
MKHQNIVMLCQQNWESGLDSNARNLAREIARHNRVLYVNLPLDVSTLVRGYRDPATRARLRSLGRKLPPRPVAPNLWVYTPRVVGLSINWLPSRPLFRLLNRLNGQWLARSIARATRQLGFPDYILLQDGLIFQGLELPGLLRPRQFVYYLRDFMIAVPYFQRHGPWAEAQLMQQADAVVANSAYLRDYARQHTPRSYDIGQGCVLTRYQANQSHPEPADLAAVPRPRLGFTGYLTSLRLDLALLLAIARQRPHWQLVLVGPQDADFAASELHQLPNVHFLGNKAPDELPAYLAHVDVCINPQAVNEITIGNYPLKVDEYLAMGKPVVASATRTMELFARHVYLATGPQQWLAMLERALVQAGPGTAAARIAFAGSHTWAASVAALYQALQPPQPTSRPAPISS